VSRSARSERAAVSVKEAMADIVTFSTVKEASQGLATLTLIVAPYVLLDLHLSLTAGSAVLTVTIPE